MNGYMVMAVIIILSVLFFFYDILPNLLTRFFRLHTLWRGPMRSVVSLTFDDGPDPRYTPRLLQTLRAAHVHATFFVIAEKAMRNPDIIREMLRDGHDVQIHGWVHKMVPLLGPVKAVSQVDRSARLLDQTFGVKTRFYRPTWGLCNAATLLSRKCRGHQLVTWSIMIGDWRRETPECLIERILARLHPGGMIVLHDSDETFGAQAGAPDSVIACMPELIRQIRNQGYSFETVSSWLNERKSS